MADEKKSGISGAAEFGRQVTSFRYRVLKDTGENGLGVVGTVFVAGYWGDTYWRIEDRTVSRCVIEKAVLDRLVAEKSLEIVKPVKQTVAVAEPTKAS